ncbi:MAG: DUF4369 domain-containing protein [Allomuricauda sp.]|nr:MAG: DUF4369 domain-containing protein [Allomuricauda sp.]
MGRSIATLILIVLFSSCSTKSEKTMVVSGTIDGLKKGTLFLQKIQDSVLTNIDSLEIRGDASFVFEQAIESPEIFYLYLEKADNNDINDRIVFFGEPGSININTSWNQFESKAQITGSKNHEVFKEYQAMMTNFNKRDLELAQLALAAGDSIDIDSVEGLAEQNYYNRYRYILNFGLTNPTTHVAPYVAITDGTEANPIYLDSIYKVLPDSVANGKYGRLLKTTIDKN